MKYNKNDIITLNNNLEYIIVDTITIDNSNYLYLINNSDNDDVVLLKTITINGIETLVGIDNEEEFDKVFTKLAISNKDTLINFLNEDNN